MKQYEFKHSILRKYDIRGITGVDLNKEDGYFLGLAFVNYLRSKNFELTVAVAKDARQSGVELQNAVIQGIVDGGGTAVDCGICPTPVCYFASYHYKTQGFIMVTGSHNPLDYNGFKFGIAGIPFSEEEILNLAQLAKNGVYEHSGGKIVYKNPLDAYIERITKDVQIPNLRFGFNALNGSAGVVLPELVAKIGGIFFECEQNPNLQTVLDPSNLENIERNKQLLQENSLDIIFMFDGDADRIVAATRNKVLYGEDILLLCAREVLAKEKGKIIFDVKCSNSLENEIRKQGGVPIMYKTGHSLIKKKMLEESAILAGEYSGHIYFGNGFYGFDDGIYTAMRLIGHFANKNFDDEINSIPRAISSPEIKIPSKTKFDDIRKLQNEMQKQGLQFNDIDGIRFNNTENSWFLIRASNTEEVLIARYEGCTQNEFDAVKILFEELIAIIS
jgi:phosphomannomutase